VVFSLKTGLSIGHAILRPLHSLLVEKFLLLFKRTLYNPFHLSSFSPSVSWSRRRRDKIYIE